MPNLLIKCIFVWLYSVAFELASVHYTQRILL